MNYQKLADDIEKDLLKQIKRAYIEAYRKATKEIQKYQKLIDNMAELEKGLPEDWTKEQIEHWRMGFYTQQSRFYQIRKNIERFFEESGQQASELIQDTLPDYYNLARQHTIDNIHLHSNISFSMLNKNEIKTIISDQQPVFSKIAFNNLGKNKKMRDMLSSELLQSILLGESKEALKRRIKRVAGYQYNYQALRTAQTERTRVQSQASYATAKEAQSMGLKITKRWSATMKRTRDTHAELNGKTIPIDEDFELSDGDKLSYPGDPKGRACNIINCRCDVTYEVDTGKAKNKDISDDYLYDDEDDEDVKVLEKDEIKNFKELEKRLKKVYNITVDDKIFNLDFETVNQSIMGIQEVIDDFPVLKGVVKKIGIDNNGLMSASYANRIYLNKTYYKPKNKLLKIMEDEIKTHHSPDNFNIKGIGYHEMGHIIENYLTGLKYKNYNSYVKALDKCEIASDIVNNALLKLRKNDKYKNITEDVLKTGVSRYAKKSNSECLAEAIADYKINKSKASPLSIKIWEIIKERVK